MLFKLVTKSLPACLIPEWEHRPLQEQVCELALWEGRSLGPGLRARVSVLRRHRGHARAQHRVSLPQSATALGETSSREVAECTGRGTPGRWSSTCRTRREGASGEGPCPRAALRPRGRAGSEQRGRLQLVRRGVVDSESGIRFSIPLHQCRPAELAESHGEEGAPHQLSVLCTLPRDVG